MVETKTSARNTNFSHIYVENDARGYADTERILNKFDRARIIGIDDYRAVFNRHNQHFQAQKLAMKLIIAIKRNQLIYDGSPYAPSFGHPHFYYNAPILNCVYNCDYCYLQGMYTSGNIVVFVNSDDFFAAAEEVLAKYGGLYLCISYDTDLLAFENVIPNCRRWITWAEERPGVVIEVRTKSANFQAISDMAPPANTILAWTLSPETIASRYEKKAPPLSARLTAVREALNAGWKVRVCVDPVLRAPDWQSIYGEFVECLSDSIAVRRLHDISIGTFRMNATYLERIRRIRKDSDILHFPFKGTNGICGYGNGNILEMLTHVRTALRAKADGVPIYDACGSVDD